MRFGAPNSVRRLGMNSHPTELMAEYLRGNRRVKNCNETKNDLALSSQEDVKTNTPVPMKPLPK